MPALRLISFSSPLANSYLGSWKSGTCLCELVYPPCGIGCHLKRGLSQSFMTTSLCSRRSGQTTTMHKPCSNGYGKAWLTMPIRNLGTCFSPRQFSASFRDRPGHSHRHWKLPPGACGWPKPTHSKPVPARLDSQSQARCVNTLPAQPHSSYSAQPPSTDAAIGASDSAQAVKQAQKDRVRAF